MSLREDTSVKGFQLSSAALENLQNAAAAFKLHNRVLHYHLNNSDLNDYDAYLAYKGRLVPLEEAMDVAFFVLAYGLVRDYLSYTSADPSDVPPDIKEEVQPCPHS